MTRAAKEKMRELVQAALKRMRSSGEAVNSFRGVALYDTAKDVNFTSLPEFGPAEVALTSVPLLQQRYGGNEALRLTLQFVYQMLERLSEPAFDEAVFEALWDDFLAELQAPEWVFRALANLRYCKGDAGPFDLGNGVSIRARSLEELQALGFSEWDLQQLVDDVGGFGFSPYVILIEDKQEKAPDNFILANVGTEFMKAQRAIGALRLLAPGDIGAGRMWMTRSARFNVGHGGSTSSGQSLPPFGLGSEYELTHSIADQVPPMYRTLEDLERNGYGGAPGNLALALGSFMATYDRWPPSSESRVVDAITAIEAVLGTDAEITFKLSFRVAGILANDDGERLAIFNDMKAYYGLRSKIVHGATLKDKHRALLNDIQPLRDLVRRLLRGFIHLAIAHSSHSFGKQFFQDQLDASLQEAEGRSALRRAMGFEPD